MAKQAVLVRVPMEFDFSPEALKYLASMTDNESLSETDRAKSVILTLVKQQTDGGLMLTSEELKKIQQSTGVDPSCGEDLLPYLAEGSGYEDGCRIVKVHLDPTKEAPIQEIADQRCWSFDQVITETVNHVLDNDWYEQLPDKPDYVQISKEDHRQVEELLGGKFHTGTQLVALIKEQLGGSLFEGIETQKAPEPVEA